MVGLCVAEERARAASSFAEASLKTHSALRQEFVSLWDRLSAAVSTSSVNAESKFASLCEDLDVASAMIDKLCGKLETGRDQAEYNRCRASDQYSRSVDERLSAAVDAETQTPKRNTELVVRLAGEAARRSRITDSRARVMPSLDGLGMDAEAIVMRSGDLMDKMRLDLTALFRESLRAACDEFINLAVVSFTAASVSTSAASGAGCDPSGKAVPSGGVALMGFEIVPSESVPVPAKDGDAITIKKAVAVLNGDESFSHLSASHAVNAPFIAQSDYDKSFAVAQDPPSSSVADHVFVIPSVATGAVPSVAMSASGTRSIDD